MFIRFIDEDDNAVIWALIAIVTMPIWGSIILLLQGLGKAKEWIVANADILHLIIAAIIALIAIVTSIIVLVRGDKNTPLLQRIALAVLPCIGTAIATYNLFQCMDTVNNLTGMEDGFFGAIEFIIWIVLSALSALVVIIVQIISSIGAWVLNEAYGEEKSAKIIIPYLMALLPSLEIAIYLIFDIEF